MEVRFSSPSEPTVGARRRPILPASSEEFVGAVLSAVSDMLMDPSLSTEFCSRSVSLSSARRAFSKLNFPEALRSVAGFVRGGGMEILARSGLAILDSASANRDFLLVGLPLEDRRECEGVRACRRNGPSEPPLVDGSPRGGEAAGLVMSDLSLPAGGITASSDPFPTTSIAVSVSMLVVLERGAILECQDIETRISGVHRFPID